MVIMMMYINKLLELYNDDGFTVCVMFICIVCISMQVCLASLLVCQISFVSNHHWPCSVITVFAYWYPFLTDNSFPTVYLLTIHFLVYLIIFWPFA